MRPPTYTDEQDDIILSTTDSTEVNRIFRERGFEERPANAIAKRREYLKKEGRQVAVPPTAERRLPKLLARLRVIDGEIQRCRERITRLEEERVETADTVKVLTQELLPDDLRGD